MSPDVEQEIDACLERIIALEAWAAKVVDPHNRAVAAEEVAMLQRRIAMLTTPAAAAA